LNKPNFIEIILSHLKYLFNFYHTIKYLKPIQIGYKIQSKILPRKYKTKIVQKKNKRKTSGKWKKSKLKNSSMLTKNRFSFLNHESSVIKNTDWNDSNQSKLWLYNLHYFDDLNSTSGRNRDKWHNDLIKKWIDENPPAFGIGWESYPTSLRITNWIKWALNGHKLKGSWEKSILLQTTHLVNNIEYAVLANHLIANAKALIFSGAYFESKSNVFFDKGMEILKQELSEQILPDGGHFELSPMYHALIIEDILDLINLATVYSNLFPAKIVNRWSASIKKMLSWLETMTHPDGEISFFNDSAFKISARLTDLIAYANSLGIQYVSIPLSNLVHLKNSGYVRINNNNLVSFIDVAKVGPDYQPGHAHADTLSFELSINNRRIIVNSGTSTYKKGRLRQWQRSTAAHNTVEINDENSSEVWDSFKVARRTKPTNVSVKKSINRFEVKATINLIKKVKHARIWNFNDYNLLITDIIYGRINSAKMRLYFYPDCRINFINDKAIEVINNDAKLLIKSSNTFEIIDSFWFPEFGKSLSNKCIIFTMHEGKNMTEFKWHPKK